MSTTRQPRGSSTSRQQSAPRSTQAVVVVVALLCVAAIVALGLLLRGGDEEPATASDAGCEAAPPLPSNPPSFESPPDPALAQGATWNATISTNCGDITLQLDGAKAPQTVASFISLSQQGYFDDSPCHRLTTSGLFVLQCGDPTGTGTGGPGYTFGIENAPKDGDYPTGTVAMARTSAPDSNGSQFFIVYQDSKLPTDGGGYSIFGTVTEGLSIVKELAKAGVSGGGSDGAPDQPISILGVSVERV